MSKYGSKSSEIKDVSRISYGIHENVTLAEVKAFTTEAGSEGGTTYEVLDLIFKNEAGEQFQHRMFNPDSDSDKARSDKSSKRYSDQIAYVAKKIKGQDVDLIVIGDTWADFTKASIALIGSNYNQVKLGLKLIGNVYNNKANINITPYFGWLERMDSGKLPKFSEQEIKGNQAYDNFFIKDEGGKGAATASSETPVF